jgi:hypothetical protein
MAMSLRSIPVGADTVEVLSGRITKQDAWTFGKKVTCTHKVFYGSDGYKSDYQSHRIEFIILAVEGEKTRAYRYSGKNLPFASKMKEDLRPHLATEENNVSLS